MSVRDVVQAAAGALGGEATYVENVFSTYLYKGNGSGQVIENGIALGDTNAGPCVPFNGSQYLSRTSDFVGNSDGSTFTLSFWALITNTYSTIFRSDNGRVEVYINSRRVAFDFKNTSGTSIWRGNTATNTVLNYQWYHILISVTAGGPAKIYINDNNVTSGISYVANTSGTFDFTDTSWGIGAYANGSLLMAGKLTEFFFDKTYRDLDIVANRRLFITADGEPATGLASLNPLIYLPLNDTVSVGTNEGTGGDFVPINGLSSSETGGPYTEAGYGQGGMVWMKARSNASSLSNVISDTERGIKYGLITNSTSAQPSITGGNVDLYAFNSNGFSVGSDNNFNVNTNGWTFASWTFRKATKFFDVVTYTGDGVAGRTVSHNLGSVPGCMIVKSTSLGTSWHVYHRGLASPSGQFLYLNDTSSYNPGSAWNYTSPTDTEFTLGSVSTVNGSGETYVAYLFAHDDGGFGDDGAENVISCGSFTTDGSGNATVTLGYEPQWILVKNSGTSATNWFILDSMRGFTASGSNDQFLYPNLTNAEGGADRYNPTATGFTCTDQGNTQTYIYIAIRRGPMKTPEAGTEVLGLVARTGTGVATTVESGVLNDLAIIKNRGAGTEPALWANRLTGPYYMKSAQTGGEISSTTVVIPANPWDLMGGMRVGSTSAATNASGSNFINYQLRRSPGFFDMVAYTGTGGATTVAHGLGAVPEFIIVKKRNTTGGWTCYHKALGNDKNINLNEISDPDISDAWNNTTPTNSVFSVYATGAGNDTNTSGHTFIAYLFATVAGVSKVGSYTGTAADLNVDCGFSAGARFILIKRTDIPSTGGWYVWDSARGITAGNDPYFLINSSAAEVTSTDYIDPLSSGFTVTSSAPVALNASGGSYIFLAIA